MTCCNESERDCCIRAVHKNIMTTMQILRDLDVALFCGWKWVDFSTTRASSGQWVFIGCFRKYS